MWQWFRSRGERSWRFPARHVLVSLAILALSLSVTTRVFHGFGLALPSAQAYAASATRQHLAADAVELTSPFLPFAEMLLPVAAPHAPPAESTVYTVEFSEVLYNRPPPFSSLLN
jgi:hypothetical protein